MFEGTFFDTVSECGVFCDKVNLFMNKKMLKRVDGGRRRHRVDIQLKYSLNHSLVTLKGIFSKFAQLLFERI